MHTEFDRRLVDLAKSGVSGVILGEVLSRVMIAAPAAVPRVDIANGTMLAHGIELSQPSVSKATSALLGAGLLVQGANERHRPGRPIQPLALNSGAWGMLGVHVHHRQGRPVALTGVLTTLGGEVIGDPQNLDLPINEEQKVGLTGDLVGHIADLARALRSSIDGASRTILGLGIEIGGHVHAGQVVESTNAGWFKVDISALLSKELDLPVVIENDANALAVWETYRHRHPERDLALVAVYDDGVGGALILDGNVYRGGHGMAGEIGHLTVDYSRPANGVDLGRPAERPRFNDPCPCGRYGHVDALATPTRILGELDLSDLEQAAKLPGRDPQGGLTTAGHVFWKAGIGLGRGLVDLINVVNPARLLLLLPPDLASASPTTAGAEYRLAVENAVDQAFSTGSQDARAGQETLTVHELDPAGVAVNGARAAAIRVLDAFVEHTAGRDECAIHTRAPSAAAS